MMMEQTNLVPKRRFREFQDTDAWEQRELGVLAESFEYGLNAAAMEYDGENKYLRITDISDETHEFKTDVLTSPDVDLATAKKYQLKTGDVLFARTGASVGKSYRYKESDGLVYFAGFLIRARIKPEYDYEFVFQNTLTDKYDRFIKITSQRSGQPGVNAQEYAAFELSVPKLDEQRQIGAFFNQLDNLIALHQRKLDKTKALKSAYLSEMFPAEGESEPKRRLSGFTDAWEQRTVSELADRYDNLRVPITASNRVAGNTPYYGANGIQDYVEGYTHDGEFILVAEDGANDLQNYPVQYVNGKVWVNNHAHVLQAKSEIADNKFLMNALKQKNIEPYLVGGGRAKLNADIMMKINFRVPKLAEQKQIGSFFANLDNLITLHQRKLGKLQNIKKAYLNEMFV